MVLWKSAPLSETRRRPATIAASVASLAVDWMHPPPSPLVERNDSGRPIARPIWSSRARSSSLAAGEVAQSMPCWPKPALSNSPMIAGPVALQGK